MRLKMRFGRAAVAALTLGVSLSISACGGNPVAPQPPGESGGGPPITIPPPAPAPTPSPAPTPGPSVINMRGAVNNGNIPAGAQRQIRMFATFPDGSEREVTSEVLAWSSSDDSAATVDSRGMALGRTPRTSPIIKGFYGGMWGGIIVNIIDPVPVHTLKGKVFTEQPFVEELEGAVITVTTPGADLGRRGVSGPKGLYEIPGIVTRQINVMVVLEGFASRPISYELDGVTTRDIRLERK